MLHSEAIEWQIVKVERDRVLVHSEGAQTVFGRTRAQKILKQLGAGWFLRSTNTGDEPDEAT